MVGVKSGEHRLLLVPRPVQRAWPSRRVARFARGERKPRQAQAREAYRGLERDGETDLVFVARPSTLVVEAGAIAREMEQALAVVTRP